MNIGEILKEFDQFGYHSEQCRNQPRLQDWRTYSVFVMSYCLQTKTTNLRELIHPKTLRLILYWLSCSSFLPSSASFCFLISLYLHFYFWLSQSFHSNLPFATQQDHFNGQINSSFSQHLGRNKNLVNPLSGSTFPLTDWQVKSSGVRWSKMIT